MSSKVDMFLLESGGNNFTETAPRPPVPGEENEKESNGGMSTKSSGSHKSQVSQTSGRSMGSTKGDINPATPRKSNIDKLSNVSCLDEDMDAPLGFEPEGSVANSPPFTENSTPPYLKWAESLHYLLDDRDGVQLFRTFLEIEEIGSASLDFWFACLGLKGKERKENEMLQVIKIIHKKYIKSDKLPFIDANTKRTIAENIQRGITVTLFDDAQSQVENYMKNDTYPLFLKSDLYVQYVSKEGDSPKSSNSSSGSNSASRPVSSGPLPTLKEDQELATDDFVMPYSVLTGPPPSKHHNRSAHCDTKRPESSPYQYHHHRPIPPYHVSYAPTSAQDSEIQSLSSQDCLTDDTKSLTDNSSIDGHSHRESRRHQKKQKMYGRLKPSANRELERFIPRTERAPKDRNIAETDCKQFAEMLIERLLRVQKEREREREKEERMQSSLKAMTRSDVSENLDKTSMSTTSSKNNTTATSIVPLLNSSYLDTEENANSILDDHCSRIWESPAQQTPNRSPGRHSPRSKSPDRFRKSVAHGQSHSGTSSMPGTLHVKPIHGKKRTDFSHSMSSFDSGVGDDLNKCSVETHKHIHHHHHHHHEKVRKNKQKLELQAQQHSMLVYGTPRHHSASGTRQKSSRATSSDASNLDSGISMIESHQEISMLDPANTKVLQWIMDNENLNRGASSAYTDSDKTSSTHKRSNKSAALNLVQQQPYKQSGSKKASGGHMNRSASADSGSRVPWIPQGGVMPSQPIAQDPSMPMMPPPNTRVQLEEVNRRLNAADAMNTVPVKSKSFTGGVPSKDRRPGMSTSQGSAQEFIGVPSARPVPVPSDLDTSTETGTCRKTSKRSSGSGNTSGSSKPEEISVGYYFCGEPIPYKTAIPLASVTLGQLKHYISKRGNFRYFVKTYSNDFDSEAVYEEIREDHKMVPVYDGKILVKIERRDDLDCSTKSSGSEKKYQL